MKFAKVLVSAVGVLALGAFTAEIATADLLISKRPDFGPFWQPIGNSGTYVYADCFIAPAGPNNMVSTLGSWLQPLGAPNSIVRFEIWGDGNGPNCGAVLAATASFSTNQAGLNLHTHPVVSGGGPLTAGVRYWFVITAVNQGNPTLQPYQTGGHTQNSVYQDNCTFWYSNAPDGCAMDGQSLTPEMAFEALLTPGATAVEPVSWGRIKSTYR